MRWLLALLTLATTAPAQAWEPGVEAAARYADSRQGVVSFHVREGRRRWGHHGGRETRAASTVKVVLALAYLRRPGVRRRALTRADRALLAPTIRRSDDVTATRIRDLVGNPAVARVGARLGLRDFRVDPIWGQSTISARDLSRMFARVRAVAPRRHRSYLMRLLAAVVPSQRWGIGRATPDGWRLHLKGGWGSGSGAVNHQGALLVRGSRRVALGITTVGNPSHGYGSATLEGVARRLLRGLSPAG